MRHALGQLVERVAQRQAEVLLIEGLLELGADRRRQLVGHHAQRRLERVAGANRARQQVERFGELLLELLHRAGRACASARRTAATPPIGAGDQRQRIGR